MNYKLFLVALLIPSAAASISTNVIGNVTQTKFSDAPWMVSLQVKDGDYAFCGATLIRAFERPNAGSDTECHGWVITAASCWRVAINPVTTLGNINLKTKNESIEIVFKVEGEFINDMTYITNTSIHRNDLALLYVTFNLSVTASSYYETTSCGGMPILPYESAHSINESYFETMNASIYGWGLLDDNGPLQKHLYSTPLPLRSDKDCTNKMGLYYYNSTTMLCAGGGVWPHPYPYRYGPNSYDTGGPLVCQYEVEGNGTKMIQYKYLCGVTSFGPFDGERKLPAVYMDIANFAGWITDTITEKERNVKK